MLTSLVLILRLTGYAATAAPPPSPGDAILLEGGAGYILLESGDKILLG